MRHTTGERKERAARKVLTIDETFLSDSPILFFPFLFLSLDRTALSY